MIFLFYSIFSTTAESMNFTQYYAIETNVKNDKELEKVIEQTHNELNGKTFEYTDTFIHPKGVTTNTKFIKVDGEIKNFNKILIDTIKRDAKGEYSAKVCIYNIKDGKRTKIDKAISHLYKYDEVKKEYVPLLLSELKEDIIQKIVAYSSIFCIDNYRHEKWLNEEKIKEKEKEKNKNKK